MKHYICTHCNVDLGLYIVKEEVQPEPSCSDHPDGVVELREVEDSNATP
jgi:hypothetical protein